MNYFSPAVWCDSLSLTAQHSTACPSRRSPERGFSLPQLSFAALIMAIIMSIAIPGTVGALRIYRVGADARAIAAQLSLARMRAGTNFTQARVRFDTAATPGSYVVEVWNKTSGAFQLEGATEFLSRDVSFGFGTITTPAGGQSTIQQSGTILFNSRGVAVDSGGVPTGTYAIYITNGRGMTYAVTASASGKIKVWQYNGTSWVTS